MGTGDLTTNKTGVLEQAGVKLQEDAPPEAGLDKPAIEFGFTMLLN